MYGTGDDRVSLTNEQRAKMNALMEDRRKRKKEQAVLRVKEQMSVEMIEDFAKKYEFADHEVSVRLKKLLDELPSNESGKIDFNKLPAHRKFSVQNTDTRKRIVWFCSLCGGEEIFEVFVKGRLADFLADYDGWYFYGAYMLLVYEDFNGFVYIDDNGNMTEAFFR